MKAKKALNAPSFLVGIAYLKMLVMFIIVGLMTSCQQPGYRDQNGFWRTYPPIYPSVKCAAQGKSGAYPPGYLASTRPPSVPDWQTNQCAGQRSQAQVSPAVVQAPVQATKKTVATNATKRLPQPQPHWVLPSVPQKGYTARWDKRPYDRSPSGLYWVLDSLGNRWSMPPGAFWPFWSRCVSKGVEIHILDPYDPRAR